MLHLILQRETRNGGGKVMPDYQKMYLYLFNAVTDALEIMNKGSESAEMLRHAQRECEEIYISDGKSSEHIGIDIMDK